MSNSIQALAESLQSRFGDSLQSCSVDRGQVTIELRRQDQLAVCTVLRDEAPFNFEQMMDLCGVDYSAYGEAEWITEDASGSGFSRGVDANTAERLQPVAEGSDKVKNTGRRFAVVMQLLSIEHNQRLRVRTLADDDLFPVVDSVISVWSCADWFEREAFDLFGLMFEGHPDLRRLLTDYGFIGHPFRKDFPLIGNVEVRYDEEKKRVVYQPVSIEPRVLVPRVIRGANQKEPAVPVAAKSDE